MKPRHLAVYLRVSSSQQNLRSQEPDLEQWLKAYAGELPVKRYSGLRQRRAAP